MDDQSRGETVVRPVARAKVKSAVMAREIGRGQSGERQKALNLW